MFTKLVLFEPNHQFPKGVHVSGFVVKSFSWLRVERRVVYKVTDEQRHGGGEREGICQVKWLLPSSALRRMRTEADEADFSRALGTHAMMR